MRTPPRPLPPLYFFGGLLIMIALDRWSPGSCLIRDPYTFIGFAPIVAGLLLATWSNLLFRRAKTTIKPFQTSSVLVSSGPFGFSRNPMYVSMTLVLIGAALYLGTLGPWIVPVLFPVLVTRLFIRAEEGMLLDTFGETYRDYQKSVRRWL